jgi:hypothetical protein
MTKRSFASKLPKDLRQEMDRQIVEGTMTVDELWAFLRGRGVDVGRSSVHRHMQSIEEVAADMRRAREAASAIVEKLGPDAADGSLGALLIEIVQNIAFKIAQDRLRDPDGPGLNMEDLMFLTSAVQKLSSAQKTDADRILKVRQELAKEAVKAVDQVGKAKGLSGETIDAIKHAVLGVAA